MVLKISEVSNLSKSLHNLDVNAIHQREMKKLTQYFYFNFFLSFEFNSATKNCKCA